MPIQIYDRRGDCCYRQPKPGEKIHPDLTHEPLAALVWRVISYRVEAMGELVSEDCPADLTQTLYYRNNRASWPGEGVFLEYLRYKQRVGLLTKEHGYEVVGWPVVRRTLKGEIGFLEGMHRMATMRALGRPVQAILIERE